MIKIKQKDGATLKKVMKKELICKKLKDQI